MKSGKQYLTDGMELPDQDKIRTLGENETYKYLGIVEADAIKQLEMKNKIKKEYLRRSRKLHETKQSHRNLLKWISTWDISIFTNPFRSERIWQKVNFPSPRLVAQPSLKNLVCPTNYP